MTEPAPPFAQAAPPHAYSRILSHIVGCPLLVLPETAHAIYGAVVGHGAASLAISGRTERDDGLPKPPPYALANGVATIPVRGELVARGSWLTTQSGLTSYDALTSALRQACADSRVSGILLDMDSPGGEAAGAMETADVVREISTKKKVVAFVNSLAASAAYAIAAAADKIVVPPSSTVGSIGVVWLHLDRSEQAARAGVKPTLLHAGAYKVDGHSLRALDASSRARIQGQIDGFYDVFVASVGKHRPQLGAAGARRTEAAVFMGQKAVNARLADAVGTIETALQLLSPAPPFAALQSRKELSMPSLHRAAPAASVAPPAVQTQAQTDEHWGGVIDKLNLRHGLASPPSAVALPATAGGSESVGFAAPAAGGYRAARERSRQAANALAARQGLSTQAAIDASYSQIVGRLNATLPQERPGSAGAAADGSKIVADLKDASGR